MMKFVKKVCRTFYSIFFSVQIVGEDNFPKDSGFVICANHISQHDPVVLGSCIRTEIYAMAKKEIFKYKLTNWFFNNMNTIPVDRENMDLRAIKAALRILKKNKKGLLIFAEGTRNFNEEPLEAKAGVAMLAIKAKVPIVPVSIDSTYKFFSPINIKIGEPIYFEEYYGQRNRAETYQKISQEIIDDIYSEMSLYKLR